MEVGVGGGGTPRRVPRMVAGAPFCGRARAPSHASLFVALEAPAQSASPWEPNSPLPPSAPQAPASGLRVWRNAWHIPLRRGRASGGNKSGRLGAIAGAPLEARNGRDEVLANALFDRRHGRHHDKIDMPWAREHIGWPTQHSPYIRNMSRDKNLCASAGSQADARLQRIARR